jgi:hypothetical protein
MHSVTWNRHSHIDCPVPAVNIEVQKDGLTGLTRAIVNCPPGTNVGPKRISWPL